MHYLANGFQTLKQCYYRITLKNTLLPLQDKFSFIPLAILRVYTMFYSDIHTLSCIEILVKGFIIHREIIIPNFCCVGYFLVCLNLNFRDNVCKNTLCNRKAILKDWHVSYQPIKGTC